MDIVTIANSSLRNNRIAFHTNKAMTAYGPTRVNMVGNVFGHPGKLDLLVNRVPGKAVVLRTSGSMELSPDFAASVVAGGGSVSVDSDLTGLRK